MGWRLRNTGQFGWSHRTVTDRLRANTWSAWWSCLLVPRTMTMNGDHQSLAAAPLDLRTTNRERGTPNCKGRVRDALPLAESGASRKRPADKISSRLPFRKRPIHVEPDAQTQPATLEPCGHRVSLSEESTIRQSIAGQSAAENRLDSASVIPKRKAEDGRWNPAEYPVRCLNPTDYVPRVLYGKLFKNKTKYFKESLWMY